MIVAFETERLRTICEDPAVAVKALGASTAANLRGRLADIRAATKIEDLLVGRPRLSGQSDEYLIISLGEERNMVWTPNHVTARTMADGKTDWTRVTRVRLLRLEVRK